MTASRPDAASSAGQQAQRSEGPLVPPSPYARRKAARPAGPAAPHGSVSAGERAEAARRPAERPTDRPADDAAGTGQPQPQNGPATWSGPAEDFTPGRPPAPARPAAPEPEKAAPEPSAPLQVTPHTPTPGPGAWVDDDTPMLRPRRTRPRQGWQALAYGATGGLWNPGPGAREARQIAREEQIATQLRGKHVTAFFCLKGGVSKTSTTAATSLALSNLRPDPVFAIDANPDAGDLAERVVGRRLSGITALARNVEQIDSLDALSQYTVTSGRLTVLPGEPNPTLGDSLTSGDFRRIMEVVQQYYSFVQVDCGTGVTHPLMEGILEYADTVVVPAAWSITGARRAAETIRWLADNGFAHLARTSIVVLTAKDVVSRNVDKDAVLAHLGHASDLVVVPADPHVADGAVIDWDLLAPATREAYLEIAAAITSRFRTS